MTNSKRALVSGTRKKEVMTITSTQLDATRFCPCGMKLNPHQKIYCSHKCSGRYTPEGIPRSQTRNKILRYIQTNYPVSANQISRNLDIDKNNTSVRYHLQVLMQEGKIIRRRSLKDARMRLYLPSEKK